MSIYKLNGTTVEVDDSLECCDYFLIQGRPQLNKISWDKLLLKLESGEMEWDAETQKVVRDLSRWVNEAPRKRQYRDEIIKGSLMGVGALASTENFFPMPGGDKIIDALENTGKIAAMICEAYGVEPMRPLNHPDPTKGISNLEDWETPK